MKIFIYLQIIILKYLFLHLVLLDFSSAILSRYLKVIYSFMYFFCFDHFYCEISLIIFRNNSWLKILLYFMLMYYTYGDGGWCACSQPCWCSLTLRQTRSLCLKWENFSVIFDLVCFLFLPFSLNISHSFTSLLKFPFFVHAANLSYSSF